MKNNYHIAALGGGVLVLAGLGYLGYSGNQEVSESLVPPSGRTGDDTTFDGGELADKVNTMLTGPNVVEQRKTEKGRPVNLFSSVDLFTRPGNSNDLVDILKEDPLHPPIENQWWVDNQIDPTLSDAPFQDADGDGFTNMEEYNAKTDPNDAKSYGDLIIKLAVASVESDIWKLEFFSKPSSGPQFKFLYRPFGAPRAQSNQIPSGSGVEVGSTFFESDPGQGRFKLAELIQKPEQAAIGDIMRDYAVLEDQRPNKMGKKYEIPLKPNPRKPQEGAMGLSADHTVVFQLNAIGEEGNPFKVEENGTFSLPAGGSESPYKLESVNLDEKRKPISVTVKYDGDKEITIPVPQPSS